MVRRREVDECGLHHRRAKMWVLSPVSTKFWDLWDPRRGLLRPPQGTISKAGPAMVDAHEKANAKVRRAEEAKEKEGRGKLSLERLERAVAHRFSVEGVAASETSGRTDKVYANEAACLEEQYAGCTSPTSLINPANLLPGTRDAPRVVHGVPGGFSKRMVKWRKGSGSLPVLLCPRHDHALLLPEGGAAGEEDKTVSLLPCPARASFKTDATVDLSPKFAPILKGYPMWNEMGQRCWLERRLADKPSH